MRVYLRRRLTVQSMYMQSPKEGVKLHLGGVHDVVISLRPPTEDEKAAGHPDSMVFCSTDGVYEVDETIGHVFDALADGRLPEGHLADYDPFADNWVEPDGRLKPGAVAAPAWLGVAFEEFAADAARELFQLTRRTIKVLRWRYKRPGGHAPFGGLPNQWSSDGVEWLPMPERGILHVSDLGWFQIRSGEITETVNLLIGDADEPLGHELLREAQSLGHQNVRSSLLIAVAAVETGVKELIADLVPGAAWLAKESPSSPLVDMLRKYVPTLPVRLGFDGHALAPPKDIWKVMLDAVERRNDVAHGKVASIPWDWLDSLFGAAQDLLYLFDYYRGHDWALAFVRPATRQALEDLQRAEAAKAASARHSQ